MGSPEEVGEGCSQVPRFFVDVGLIADQTCIHDRHTGQRYVFEPRMPIPQQVEMALRLLNLDAASDPVEVDSVGIGIAFAQMLGERGVAVAPAARPCFVTRANLNQINV